MDTSTSFRKSKIQTIANIRPCNRFLIDSGAESNIITIPTWNEIEILHPQLIPFKTTSKLTTAQGSTLTNYGKIQLFLVPTRTMEQKKIKS